MWWFANVEERLANGVTTARKLMETADAAWGELENAPKVFFQERSNNGAWTREWLRAIE